MTQDNTPASGAAARYTKKPVTIDAIRWTGKNLREVIAFTDGPPDTRTSHAGMAWDTYVDLVERDGLKIFTLEGKMSATIGDWIIKGVQGEHYPCKPDIFEATYSAPVAPTSPQAETALRARWAVPSGWRLVPVEPSEAMFTRFSQQIDTGVVYVGGFLQAYRCMLDAAPQPPAVLPGEQEAAPVAPAPQPADTSTAVLQWIVKTASEAKEPCGENPESPAAIRNAKLAAIAGAAAQALGIVGGLSYDIAAPPNRYSPRLSSHDGLRMWP